jgi:oxygen-independent coproporphyrinogen III oxidase
VLQLKLGGVSRRYFETKFGVDLEARFAEPLRQLRAWDFLVGTGDRIGLSRDGLLQVDRLVHEFFLPEHRHARYA